MPSAETFPPQSDIEELIRLGRIGYMRGIEDKLTAIDANSAAHRDFVTYMRVFTDGFDLKRYMAVLEAFRIGHG